jgi:hypothetical protein
VARHDVTYGYAMKYSLYGYDLIYDDQSTDADFYLARVHWLSDNTLLAACLNRRQSELQLIRCAFEVKLAFSPPMDTLARIEINRFWEPTDQGCLGASIDCFSI